MRTNNGGFVILSGGEVARIRAEIERLERPSRNTPTAVFGIEYKLGFRGKKETDCWRCGFKVASRSF